MNRLSPLTFLLLLSFTLFSSCDGLLKESVDTDKLYVKFYNDANSLYTITSIELRKRESLDDVEKKSAEIKDLVKVSETWGANILPAGVVVPPGKHLFFNLEIKNHYWAQYRIKVDDGKGNTVAIDFQGHESDPHEMSITNWGSEKRTVNVSITYNNSEDRIWINGNGDWAGIDDDETTGTTPIDF